MKKVTLLLAGLVLFASTSFSQAIDDRAVIPIAVNLNSILRLNVTSGGNIEFNFNTLDDYTNGINSGGTNAGYQTRFTVASSVDWNVFMYAEDVVLQGTDDVGTSNTMDINNIGYHIDYDGGGDFGDYFVIADESGSPVALTADETTIIVGVDEEPIAGDVSKNAFVINWRCGTIEGGGMNTGTILSQSIAADRYATNVFLSLQPAN